MNVAVASGVVVVVAAGNENDNACSYTPAYIPNAVTVGATRSDDRRSVFSNKGNCLDIFAPGTAITSAGLRSNNFETFDGTSMACPHVAGAAALYMADDPSMTPEQLLEKLQTPSSKDQITNRGDGSPNLLLFVGVVGHQVGTVDPNCPGIPTRSSGLGPSRTSTHPPMTGASPPYCWELRNKRELREQSP